MPADAAAATTIARRAKATWGYPPDWLEAWQEELTFTAATFADQAGFAAELDGIMVGVGLLESGQGQWELSNLWVEPTAQRCGVGRALLNAVAGYLRDRAVDSCRIVSDPFAELFYLREGARRIGEVPAPMAGAAERILPLMEWRVPPGEVEAAPSPTGASRSRRQPTPRRRQP